MPNQNDIMYAFQYFDRDRSGMLDRKEFKKMTKYLAGIPSSKGHW
jgi:Ca2+-binding EF-hand superfamily protein